MHEREANPGATKPGEVSPSKVDSQAEVAGLIDAAHSWVPRLVAGADEVVGAFLRYTDTELGETSEDGNFTVIEAECLAACGYPTCVQINSRYYENVSPTEVPKICEHLKSQGD